LKRLLSQDLAHSLKRKKHVLLLTDYDGTLTPIVATPEQAVLSPAIRRLLKRLSYLPHVRVGVVSGRSLKEVKHFVNLPKLLYVGNHGFEIKGPGFSFVHPQAKRSQKAFQAFSKKLRTSLQDIPGARVEWKGLTLSLHWRTVSRKKVRLFRRRIDALIRTSLSKGSYRMTRGKCVMEIRPPVVWDKGKSVAWLRKRLSRKGSIPYVIYLGDDRTDEDAFRVVNRCGGMSVLVGSIRKKSQAKFQLENPQEVSRWFKAFLNYFCMMR